MKITKVLQTLQKKQKGLLLFWKLNLQNQILNDQVIM